MATSDNEQQLRDDASVAWLFLVATTLGVLDYAHPENGTIDEFMETLDMALKMRLSKPDGPLLASRLGRMRDLVERKARMVRYRVGMKRSIDEVFDQLEGDATD